MASPFPQSRIFALPSELLEEILVVAVACGFPASIAAFGRTCHYFHRLVYHSVDNHLWREVFMTMFDDPRPGIAQTRSVTTSMGPLNYNDVNIQFDWAGEFMVRMAAESTFRKYAAMTRGNVDLFSSLDSIDIPFTLVESLRTILHVLETSSIFPPHNNIIRESPTFPAIVMQHATSSLTSELRSRNVSWVQEIIKHGYPPALVKQYLVAGRQPCRPLKAIEDGTWGYPEEGRLFHKLVFLKGFIPVPTAPLNKSESSDNAHDPPWSSIQSKENQTAAAREIARSKVYNLRYLRPERSWGPYLPDGGPVSDSSVKAKASSSFPAFEQELSRYMLNVENLLFEQHSDTEDEDYIPDDDADPDDDDGGIDDQEISLVLNSRRRWGPNFVGPQPHLVVPDYTYLAAARLLIEMNLREMRLVEDGVGGYLTPPEGPNLVSKLVDALGSLDFARMGGAPSFWESSWSKPHVENDVSGDALNNSTALVDHHGKGKDSETSKYSDEVQGWDWAGVAGHWIRVICWLDYRDLLRQYLTALQYDAITYHSLIKAVHNLHGPNSDNMGETIHFFPLTLRVIGYSRPPKPDPSNIETSDALVWKLPVIHLEGEARGSDIDSQVIRRVKGTVRMLKEGSVRWSLATFYPDEDRPEWATEAVQVGAIGSAAGLIGMWTGAEHASTDPLGPAWAWKIA